MVLEGGDRCRLIERVDAVTWVEDDCISLRISIKKCAMEMNKA